MRALATKASVQLAHIPAPIGGLDQVSPGSAMDPANCVQLVNMMASELGLRARLGWREWCANLGGLPVKSILPFTGSATSGAGDKLFACTAHGIWDVSAAGAYAPAWVALTTYQSSSIIQAGNYVTNDTGKTYACTTGGISAASGGPTGTGSAITDGTCVWAYVASNIAPTEVIAFPASTDDAGWGTCHVMVTSAGHFLLYADEENGLYVYSESGATWTKYVPAATSAWVASTYYAAGTYVLNDTSHTYVCTTPGISAGAGGPTGVVTTPIVDGTAEWTYVPQVVSGVDPALLCFVTVWKNRVWAVEKNTARAWYFGINAVYAPTGAAASSFNFGGQFRSGGGLRGLWNWTLDGGVGIDDHLVGISDGGDVAIYKGTDPSSASTFGLTGVWYVGALPAGRRIASNFSGDVLIISALGAIPLSRVVGGAQAADQTQYATGKVSNLFSLRSQSFRGVRGWAIVVHPEDNALMVLAPVASNQATQQIVMSLGPAKGWSQYADLPIFSAEAWGGKLYFGTADGRVCINDGYTDGVLLSDAGASAVAVQYSGLSAFQNLGDPRTKRVQFIRPVVLAGSNAPNVSAQARFDFDLSELATVTTADGTGDVWDVGTWDDALWGPDYTATQQIFGATGMGTSVAVAWRGAANTRTVLTGIDIAYQTGGFL